MFGQPQANPISPFLTYPAADSTLLRKIYPLNNYPNNGTGSVRRVGLRPALRRFSKKVGRVGDPTYSVLIQIRAGRSPKLRLKLVDS